MNLLGIVWNSSSGAWVIIACFVVVIATIALLAFFQSRKQVYQRAAHVGMLAGIIASLRSDSQRPAMKSHPEDVSLINETADYIRDNDLRPLLGQYRQENNQSSSQPVVVEASPVEEPRRNIVGDIFSWVVAAAIAALIFLAALLLVLWVIDDEDSDNQPATPNVATATAIVPNPAPAFSPVVNSISGNCSLGHVSGMIDIPGGTTDLPFTVFVEWQDQDGGWHWVEGAGKEIKTTGQVNFEMNVLATPHGAKVLRVRFKDRDWVYGEKVSEPSFPPCS